ncbi:hypothetical protein NQ315_012147 [Exocentrus adspersus]|uniref:Uncharacterized protein n=1 Tax=Exocentrus adspersus TaxID=1586481 RepID=A0AAV8VZ42_9CUCU|nr:hypothetical protein NQ315_012147 [Exocentrus adspersus]
MIILNSTLCSNNFRRVGLIQAFANLATQILCLIIVFKTVMEASPHKRGYYVHGHKIDKQMEKAVTHILIDVMFFVAIDIIVYLWLIFGLLKNKVFILTGWLLFAIMELMVILISTYCFSVYITITSHSGASVFTLIIPIIVTIYLIYNLCVIYTVRHMMIKEKNAPNMLLAHRTPQLSYPPYRIPHSPYVPNPEQIQPCELHTVVSPNASHHDATFVSPPPYKEHNPSS